MPTARFRRRTLQRFLGPRVTLPVLGTIELPPPDRMAFYAALGVLAALDVIDWPIAVVVVAGHLLAEQHTSRALRGIGEALEEV